jgi:Co/Zn/Cd efflux system component
MRHEEHDKVTRQPVVAQGAARGSHDLLSAVPGADDATGSASATTVLVAFGANILVAVAKSVAALVTGSASILADAAHS